MLALPLMYALVAAQPGKIVFFDPDANFQAILSITAQFNAFLDTNSQALQLQPVTNIAAVDQLIKSGEAEFAIVSSSIAKSSRELQPLLVPKANGDPYYRKLLVDKGDGTTNDLEGKTIAATVSSGNDPNGARSILDLLRESGVKVKDTTVIPVTKDIDALLALSFGQVQAALVTQRSIDALKRINPAAASSLRIVHETPQILRPLLCATARASADRRKALVDSFRKMPADKSGQQAMKILGFEEWANVEPGMLKR